MPQWLHRLKPAAPARAHLLVAALAWTVVGGTLLYVGVRWATTGQHAYVAVLLAFAAAVGTIKSYFILDRVASRTVRRIRLRGDGRCIGGFLSPRSWFLLGAMMAFGRLLRASPIPHAAVGLVYIAVGTALLVSARSLWLAWQRHSSLSA